MINADTDADSLQSLPSPAESTGEGNRPSAHILPTLGGPAQLLQGMFSPRRTLTGADEEAQLTTLAALSHLHSA